MRGTDTRQEGLFSYVSPESRIPEHHPLREIDTNRVRLDTNRVRLD